MVKITPTNDKSHSANSIDFDNIIGFAIQMVEKFAHHTLARNVRVETGVGKRPRSS
jgi:hypothetical protein